MGYTQLFDRKEILCECKDKLPANVGEIWWVPVTYVDQVPMVFKATRADPANHEKIDFEIRDISGQDFSAEDKLPVKRLNLRATEEAIITKAKKRPCVVISRSGLSDEHLQAIADPAQKKLASELCTTSYIVAPIFSCATYAENKTFGPVMTARIKSLVYPQFFFVPAFDPDDRTDPGGVIRLDRVFATFLGRGCKGAGVTVGKEPMQLLSAQMGLLSGLTAPDFWVSIRNDLWDAISKQGHVPVRV